ncbi:MAG: glycosyltransferase [Nitrososphaerota archaeon]
MDIQLKRWVEEYFDSIIRNYGMKRLTKLQSALAEFLEREVGACGMLLEVGFGIVLLSDRLHFEEAVVACISDGTDKDVQRAFRERGIHFIVADAEFLPLRVRFDCIVMSDVVAYLDDAYEVFGKLRDICHPGTKLVIATVNPSWMLILHMFEKLGLKGSDGPHNWLSHEDIKQMLSLQGFKVSKVEKHFFKSVQLITATPLIERPKPEGAKVSFVIPCYNEEENILAAIDGILKSNLFDVEVVVVDDGSTDRTAELVLSLNDSRVKLVSYKPNQGKGVAVRRGFEAASGDIFVIVDADLSVSPDEAMRFVRPLATRMADFVNGTRFLYPMEPGAMSDIRFFGNKLFSVAFSWLLGQRITDTLCGTKAIRRSDYLGKISIKEKSWPDFDLLFGAAKNGLRIVEMPVHYKRRMAGKSKMKIFKHGLRLSRMILRGILEFKLKPFLKRA